MALVHSYVHGFGSQFHKLQYDSQTVKLNDPN